MQRFIIIFILLTSFISKAQTDYSPEVDSMISVWEDSDRDDKDRLSAALNITRVLQSVDPNKALEFAENSLKLSEEMGRDFEKAQALQNIAGIITFQGELERADSLLNLCLAMDHLDGAENYENLKGKIYLNQGNIRFFTSKFDSAVAKYNRAIEIANVTGDSAVLGRALNNKAGVNLTTSNYQVALIDYQSALKISEALSDSALMGQQLGNIANIYTHLEQFEMAKVYIRRTIKITEAKGLAYMRSAMFITMGTCQEKQGQYDSALYYATKALAIKEEIKDQKGIGIAYNNLGTAHLEKKNYGQAEEYLNSSLDVFKETDNPEGQISSLIALSRLYLELRQSSKARELYTQALRMAEEAQLDHLLRDAYLEVSIGYAESGNYQDAYKYLKKHKRFSDSLFTSENLRSVNELRTIYQTEKQKNQIASLQKEQEIQDLEIERNKAQIKKDQLQLEKEQTVRYSLFGGVALLLLIGGIVVRGYYRKKKDNKVILRQKADVENQKLIVEEKNKEILDSINYARRLQEAILPPKRLVKEWLPSSFILYKPKDIVAGDFYWMETPLATDNTVYFAAADCTGHGVPGAMVSVVCSNALSKSLLEEGITTPAKILDRTRELVIDSFARSEEEIKDGMDISLCCLNYDSGKLEWAGANNPIWLIREGSNEIEEIKADKQPIGKYAGETPFTNHTLQLKKGDALYIFSDGYPDQFGGEKGKKYKTGKLKSFLLSIRNKNMAEQLRVLNDEFETWRGDLEQIDDVCVIGVKY